MYKLKQIPEDFIVTEHLDLEFEPGVYCYYILRKKNYNTIDAVHKIARIFKCEPRFINFAGTKDRRAVTEQYISIYKGPKKDLELKDLKLTFQGTGRTRLALGQNTGNCFQITVRNIQEKPEPIRRIKNLFDDQRFGSKGNNQDIGRAIIKRDWKKAVEIIDDEHVNEHLRKHKNDYVGALKRLPKKILLLYVHAFQSYLWNKMADGSEEVPLLGFDTESTDEIEEILDTEGVSLEDFLIRQIPELSQEGSTRRVWTDVADMRIGEIQDDELNQRAKKVKVEFCLGKGSYATQVIKQMFS